MRARAYNFTLYDKVIHTQDWLLLTVVLILVVIHYLTTVGEIKLYYIKRKFCIMDSIQSESVFGLKI